MWYKGVKGTRYEDRYYNIISIDKFYGVLIPIHCENGGYTFKWVDEDCFILIGTDEDMKRELIGGR